MRQPSDWHKFVGEPVLLEAVGLHKTYRTKSKRAVIAVDGVDLKIPEGICFGLLGPNGAGKTTTVEMMEGILAPTSGEIKFRGRGIGSDSGAHYRERIGIQFQSTALQDYLRVSEVLDLFGAFYPAGSDSLALNVWKKELIELCALGDFLDRDVHELSGGQRQRVLLAVALINRPEVVFLDEPTTGLDPQARRNFWELVKKIRAQGRTVILTTHYMEEAHVLCDRLAIMDQGKVIAEGVPADLLREHQCETLEDLFLKITGKTLRE